MSNIDQLELPGYEQRQGWIPKTCKPKLIVSNNVFKVQIGQNIDRYLLSLDVYGRFSPVAFPAVVTKCKETNTTLNIFQHGKIGAQITMIGARTMHDGLYSVYLAIQRMKRLFNNPFLGVYNLQLLNLVGGCNLGMRLNVSFFSLCNQASVGTTKEIFEGYTWKPDDIGIDPVTNEPISVTFNVFDTGNIVAAGLARHDLIPIIESFLEHEMPKYELGNEFMIPTMESISKSMHDTSVKSSSRQSRVNKQQKRKWLQSSLKEQRKANQTSMQDDFC